jgi:Protochlamydia outer membrane protein
MRKNFLITFFLITFQSVIFSYEFKCFQIGPVIGYRQEEIDFGIQDPLIGDPNAIRENFDTFHVFEIGANTELLIPYRIFLRGESIWGFGNTSHATIEARSQILDFTNTFISEQRFQRRYDAKSYTLNSSVNIGMPFKFCPITLLIYFGYGYDRENITRKDSPVFRFSNSNLQFMFTPNKHLNFKFYSPIFGTGFHLRPDPCGIFKLMAEYQFYFGVLDISSSYKNETTENANFRLERQNINVKTKGLSHRFFIMTLFNLRCNFNLGLKVKYQYTSANPKDANLTILTKELNNNVFTEQLSNTQRSFNKFVWQYLGGEILFLLQF